MPNIPDLSRPILYRDEETGEIIHGGEDSPEADDLRAELAGKRKKRLANRYNETKNESRTISNSPDNT